MKANSPSTLLGTAVGSAYRRATLTPWVSYSRFRVWGFSPFIIWGFSPRVWHCAGTCPPRQMEPPPLLPLQEAAQGRNSLTVGDLHLVGRGSPLYPVAAVHGEGVRFAEKPAAKKGRQAVRTHRHPPGPARDGGCVRGRREAELLRDLGASSRLTKPSPRSCGDTTRGQAGTRSKRRQPCVGRGMSAAWGAQACGLGQNSPFPATLCSPAGGHARPPGANPHRSFPWEARLGSVPAQPPGWLSPCQSLCGPFR